ncbi:MAG: hypothetical protein NTV11_15285 [Rhodocyclales bacterium]|nr:hypothetical protein [Rhodocyclales bacterium]
MGLVIFGAMALYLVLAIFAVTGAISHARKQGKTVKCWGWGAALVMYLIPFWDWIPTVVTHQYYCATEAGFWVYKTPEQWKKENPGVMETLVAQEVTVPSKRVGDDDNWVSTYSLNQRVLWINEHRGPLLLYRWNLESTLVDSNANEVLARAIDFYTAQTRGGGGWRGWKFWLAVDHCPTHGNDAKQFGDYLAQIKGAKK